MARSRRAVAAPPARPLVRVGCAALVVLAAACDAAHLSGPKLPPVAVITARAFSAEEPNAVALDASQSYDQDDGDTDAIAAFIWAVVANPDGAVGELLTD